ncbi:MAG TPA: 2-amino-4-hydroxy-6-hydroxymethyldihydropteridine diphosphokinase [Isosphaeraceae bacterium]|nr:2-amino-4-hydroxy-6-hydroxymethyldihydropteridine diphosphokinase [Isosphaeraceae bacterium]
MRVHALIGLGSNLGDRAGHLEKAVDGLSRIPDSGVIAVSSWHSTCPVGGPVGQGEFLNAAALLETECPARDLLVHLHEIESREGRTRVIRWDARPLDLDLLLFGAEQIHEPDLIVPHPRMTVRRFVLAPAAEIAPDLVEPRTGRSVSDLLRNLDRRPLILVLDRRLDKSSLGDSDDWVIVQTPQEVQFAGEPTFAVRALGVREWSRSWPVHWPIQEVDPADPGWVREVQAAMLATRA